MGVGNFAILNACDKQNAYDQKQITVYPFNNLACYLLFIILGNKCVSSVFCKS